MKISGHKKMEAIRLRKSGYSLDEISAALDVSKSSTSLWVRGVTLSFEAAERISQKRADARQRAAQTKREQVNLKFENSLTYGKKVVQGVSINSDTVRLICALLYWCEGTKIRRREVMAFTNSDPALVAAFLKLLRRGFQIEEKRLRLSLHLHEYHETDAQLQFWSKVTNIPLTQCHKPYRKPHTGKRTRYGYQGCVSVRYLDVDFGRRLEGIAKVFLKGPVV